MKRLLYILFLMMPLAVSAQNKSLEFYYIAHDRSTPVNELCDRLEQVYYTALSYDDFAVIFYLPNYNEPVIVKMNLPGDNREEFKTIISELRLKSYHEIYADIDYQNIEYIIIDGGSKDGTQEVIKKYEKKIARWISEPDKGIYDAMNKGVKLAHGKWIAFMNAGDSYVNSDVIKNIFSKQIPIEKLVIYGKTLVHYNWGTYIITPNRLMEIKKCMP